jgi:predicted PurR-regulated permease PerM
MALSRAEYVHRVLIALGLTALALVLLEGLQHLAGALLILFAGVLLAVLLDGFARLLDYHSPLSRRAALAIEVVVLAGAAVAMGWWLGPRIGGEMGELAETLPGTMDRAEAWLRGSAWGTFIAERMPESADGALPEDSGGLGALRAAFSTVLGALANGLIVLFVGLFLAINPSLYVNALLRLVPPAHRPRGEEVASALGTALRHWLLGRIASMLVVGALTAVGLMVIGIPLALTLGLIAALFSFVPYVGPILALAPALAVAAGEGGQALVAVLIVYGAVQLVESYLVTPLIQQRAVSMPPALLIAAQVVLGTLAGAVGVAVATPLVVVVVVLVQTLYVEGVLDDDVEVMGN